MARLGKAEYSFKNGFLYIVTNGTLTYVGSKVGRYDYCFKLRKVARWRYKPIPPLPPGRKIQIESDLSEPRNGITKQKSRPNTICRISDKEAEFVDTSNLTEKNALANFNFNYLKFWTWI